MKHLMYIMLASSLAAAQPVQIGGSAGFSSCNVGPDSLNHAPMIGAYGELSTDIIGWKWLFLTSSIEYTQKSGALERVDTLGNPVYYSLNSVSLIVGPKARFNIKWFHPYFSLSPRLDVITWTIGNDGKTVRTNYFGKIGYCLFGGLEAGNWRVRPFVQLAFEDIDFTPWVNADAGEATVASAVYWAASVGVCYYFR